MNHKNDGCDISMLNRLRDGDLSDNEKSLVLAHVQDCEICANEVRENQALSDMFVSLVEKETAAVDLVGLREETLDRLFGRQKSFFQKFQWLWTPRRMLVPASATAIVLFFFLFFFSSYGPSSEPSAIVTSISGDMASVMIIGTPNKNHTIIWYSEALNSARQ